jgi:hypothetical protein
MLLDLPGWSNRATWLYLTFLRPNLLKHNCFAHGEENLLFPSRVDSCMATFLKQLSIQQRVAFTPSYVRKLFADYVGTLKYAQDSKWHGSASELVEACAHTSVGLVGRHYHSSSKVRHICGTHTYIQTPATCDS